MQTKKPLDLSGFLFEVGVDGFERRSRSGNTFEIKLISYSRNRQIILTPPTSNREEFANANIFFWILLDKGLLLVE